MATFWWRHSEATSPEETSDLHPLPTRTYPRDEEVLFKSRIPLSADISWKIALEGRIFISGDADENDRVTGQTSFAATTPTFLLNNPGTSNVLCLPFYYHLVQTGTVAGGDIAVETSIYHPTTFSSGTAEKVRNARIGMPNRPSNQCTLNSTVTAVAGTSSVPVGHVTLGPDVSPAEGVINVYEWTPPVGVILDPNSCLAVFTSAATQGPTWGWHWAWGELPREWLS